MFLSKVLSNLTVKLIAVDHIWYLNESKNCWQNVSSIFILMFNLSNSLDNNDGQQQQWPDKWQTFIIQFKFVWQSLKIRTNQHEIIFSISWSTFIIGCFNRFQFIQTFISSLALLNSISWFYGVLCLPFIDGQLIFSFFTPKRVNFASFFLVSFSLLQRL